MNKFIRLILCCLFLSFGLFADKAQFGLNMHNFPCENTIGDQGETLFRQLNVKWTRAGIDWNDIEKTQGVYTFTAVDKIVNYAHDNDINVLLVLAYNPEFYGSSNHNCLNPNYIDNWKAFITAMVNRYKSKVKYWELWNEPNIRGFWDTGLLDYTNVQCFVDWILIPGIAAIRAADPTAQVCGPDLSSCDNCNPIGWFNYITSRGVVFDVLTHHQYDGGNTANGRFAEIQTFYDNASFKGYSGKEFWITETGWIISPEGMQNMENIFNLMLAHSSWWKKTFWYAWRALDGYLINPQTSAPNALYVIFKGYSNPPHITVVSPNGGESWSQGVTYTIKWHSSWVTDVTIELLKGTVVDTIISASTNADNGSYTTYTWTVPAAQAVASNYKIRISGEYNGDTYSDSSDAFFAITSGQSQPDVVISKIELVPAAPTTGQKVTFKATIKNQGLAATPTGIVVAAAFKVDGKALGAFFVRTNGVNRPLAINESYTAACETLWTATVGTHIIWVMADDVNRFPESNENNNVMEKSFTVANVLPDVVITKIELVPATPTTGQNVTIKATIENQGLAATPTGIVVAAAFKVDGKALGAFFVRTNGVDRPLAINESYTAACETLWTATVGTHTIWVMADDVNRFPESNDNNNVRTTTIVIQ